MPLSNLPTDQPGDDDIVRRFVRQREDDRTRARWTRLLREEHGVHRESATIRPARRGVVRQLLVWGAAAAVLLLLILAVGWTRPTKGPALLTDLLAQREMAINYRTLADGESTTEALRTELHQSYTRGDYPSVIALGERLRGLKQSDSRETYYTALAQFYEGQLEIAVTTFRELTGLDLYRSVSYYYIGLARLRQNRLADGFQALREVGQDSPRHYRQAQELLEADW